MKKLFLAGSLLLFCAYSNAQVIKPGKGKSIDDINAYQKEEKLWEFKKHNMVQLNVFDFVFTDISFAYEHITKDGNHGFQLPISFNAGGLPDTNNQFRQYGVRDYFLASKNRIFQTGLNYNYYFNGQEKVSPYMGVGLGFGWFNYWDYPRIYTTTQYGTSYTYSNIGTKMIGNNYQGALFAGILFNPRETVTFNIKAGFGLHRYSTIYTEYTSGYGVFEVCLGFKFD